MNNPFNFDMSSKILNSKVISLQEEPVEEAEVTDPVNEDKDEMMKRAIAMSLALEELEEQSGIEDKDEMLARVLALSMVEK